MTILSILTAGAAAGLTFLVEPMVGRLLLPFYGGASAVWTTCLVFFQLALLSGYLIAHLAARYLRTEAAALVEVVIVAIPLLALPIALPSAPGPPAGAEPAPWLLWVLVLTVGAPFVALSTATPILQSWLAGVALEPVRAGAFRLLAAGSAGSLLGLVAYPLVVERSLDLADQERWWSLGYFVFAAAMTAVAIRVAVTALRARRREGADGRRTMPSAGATAILDPSNPTTSAAPTRADRLRWLGLAAIPTALMVGITAHLTTDVAAVPLLWVAPLAVYLVTFILAFGAPRPLGLRAADAALPLLALGVVAVSFDVAAIPLGLVFAVELGALAAAGLTCHGRLALARPAPGRLTGYDLTIAAGGAAGGILAGIVGPWLLPLPLEGAGALVLALVVRGWPPASLQVGGPGRIRAALTTVPFFVRYVVGSVAVVGLLGITGLSIAPSTLVGVVLIGALVVLAARPRVFAAAVALLFLMSAAALPPALETVRTFYGVRRVAADAGGRHALFAGTTVQGLQAYLPVADRARPLGYYYPGGPAGDLVAVVRERTDAARIAVVGLGAGAMAAFGRAGDALTFFEIDPAVAAIARDPRLFTYLADSPARVDVVIGDGRLEMARAPASSFDLVVIDAFSSDAVPVHLLTREALAIDLARIRPGGLLAVNVSNRYVDLEPVLSAAARDLGLTGLARVDDPPLERAGDEDPSHWVVLAARPNDLAGLAGRPGWRPLVAPLDRAWTDRWSDLLRSMLGR